MRVEGETGSSNERARHQVSKFDKRDRLISLGMAIASRSVSIRQDATMKAEAFVVDEELISVEVHFFEIFS